MWQDPVPNRVDMLTGYFTSHERLNPDIASTRGGLPRTGAFVHALWVAMGPESTSRAASNVTAFAARRVEVTAFASSS